MNLENIMLSETSQTENTYDITYMWNLKNKTNECILKQKQTHRYRKQNSGNLNGKEIQKRGDICTGTADSFCSMVETDTTL